MENEQDILFLGGLFPKEAEREIIELSKGNVQNAANVLQWNIVNGLDYNLKKPIKVLNSLYIGSFPLRYKKLMVESYKFNHCIGSDDYNVGFMNLMGIKAITRWTSLKPKLKEWALDGKSDKVIIAYALTSNNLRAFKYLKKLNKDVCTCIVVPDLPQYMNTSNKQSLIYKYAKLIDIKNINRNIKHADSFVLLTEYMREKLEIIHKPYIVVEGIATINNSESICDKIIKDEELKIVLYTGTLNERYGIITLLEAFKKIQSEEYRLIICGDGDAKAKIIESAKLDNRIIYEGIVERSRVLKLQAEATILINPRQDNEEFCKYSFPSKILEYLSSGIPTVAYKLRGIPEEYNKYIIYVEDNRQETLTNKIVEACMKSEAEREKIGNEAKDFVIKNKGAKEQVKKIIDMIKAL